MDTKDVNADQIEALFDYATFLATGARGSLEEGVFTASFRLVDAIQKLLALFPQLKDDPFFADLSKVLDERFRKAYFMPEAEYKAFLDDVVRQFATEIRRRNGL